MIMKNRLSFAFRRVRDRHSFVYIYNPYLYIADWANKIDGNVEISGAKSCLINSVSLKNDLNIQLFLTDLRRIPYQ